MELVSRDDIKIFVAACDKMIGSKYIMVDKRVAEVLTSIAACKPVYNLIAECMINFNFDKAYKQGTVGHNFVLPDDPKDVVAFVFCLLNCLDDKKININDLLMKYYSKDSHVSPYALFNSEVICKFKNAVYFLAVGEKIEQEVPKVEKPVANFDADINNRLVFLASDLKDYVSGVKKIRGSYLTKSEMLTLIIGFVELVKNNATYAYKACLLGIKAGAGKDKELLKRIAAIDDILIKLLID
ncbi:MAG: hypothetical protein IJW24_01885 [Clostridia bacterium]|nr:hypothetical protein [Clostridia bacterium]